MDCSHSTVVRWRSIGLVTVWMVRTRSIWIDHWAEVVNQVLFLIIFCKDIVLVNNYGGYVLPNIMFWKAHQVEKYILVGRYSRCGYLMKLKYQWELGKLHVSCEVYGILTNDFRGSIHCKKSIFLILAFVHWNMFIPECSGINTLRCRQQAAINTILCIVHSHLCSRCKFIS